jgi:hypothetical protein
MVVARRPGQERDVNQFPQALDHADLDDSAKHSSASIAVQDEEDGLDVTALETGALVSVYTRNSHYRITVLNGHAGAVIVQGGSHFPTPAYVRLQSGATTASPGRTGFVAVGRRLQLLDGPRHVVTSPVQVVMLEDVAPVQREFWRIA